MDTLEVLLKVAPILVAITLGYVLTRLNVLKDSMIQALKTIVVQVTLPVALFSSFIKIRFKSEYLLIFLSVFVACVLLYLLGKLIAKVFGIQSKYFPFLMTGFEAGMMGYALFMTVYGKASAANFGIVDIGQVSFVFLIFVPMLKNLGSKERGIGSLKESLKIVVRSPIIWAIVLGLIGSIVGLWHYEETTVFKGIDNIFGFIAAPTAFLICLVIGNGLNLSLKNIKIELLTALLKVVSALAMAVALKHLVFIPLGMNKQIITALFVLLALPAPFVIPVFMKEPTESERSYVSNTLSIGSILGVVCFVGIILLGL